MSVFLFEQVCKPGSVVNGHLSWYTVTSIIMRLFCGTERAILYLFLSPCFKWGLHSLSCYQQSGKLLPYLSTLTHMIYRRFISVALSLESPPPAVNWHPALWSPDFPHFFNKSATIQPTLIYYKWNVVFLSIIIFY